jgi:hypothetical protein
MISTILILFVAITAIVYHKVGFKKILDCYAKWFEEGYWVNYNIVEALAWGSKTAVILPALLFQKEIWWLHFITLSTSAALIWVNERKINPTLIIFNTIWIGISSIVIVRNIW